MACLADNRNVEQNRIRCLDFFNGDSMKDKQGTNIINPETIKIIRNLRGKALSEGKDRDFYLNQIIKKYSQPMRILESHAQEWCIENGIIGYEFIANLSIPNVRKSN
ncbi:MAG: hypothetical protein ACE1ZM_07670 [Gammaproteobacteria bacterium]